MTREEIAKAARTVLTEAIDAFQELARETEAFADEQGVTVYLKHVRAVADSQLSKLHQDAGNGETDDGFATMLWEWFEKRGYPFSSEERSNGLLAVDFASMLDDHEQALERGSQVGDGWVLVPREPTAEMLDAVCDRRNPAGRACYRGDWHAMLAAAPAHGGGG